MLRVADKIILLSILLSIFSAVKIIASCVSKPLEITSFARFPKGTRALRLGTFPDQFPTVENAVFNPMVISNKGNPNNLIAVCRQVTITVWLSRRFSTLFPGCRCYLESIEINYR